LAGASDPRRYRLHRKGDPYLVSDEEPACFERGVPGQPKVLPIDRSLGFEPDALVAPWIFGFAQQRDIKAHGSCHTVDRQIARYREHVVGIALDAGSAHGGPRLFSPS